jgi:hypothetical protein
MPGQPIENMLSKRMIDGEQRVIEIIFCTVLLSPTSQSHDVGHGQHFAPSLLPCPRDREGLENTA